MMRVMVPENRRLGQLVVDTGCAVARGSDPSVVTRVILTCSSFMSKGNRRAELLAAVRSIREQHSPESTALVDEFLVVNEHDDGRREDYAAAVAEVAPEVQFIQKGRGDRGQARTLNMILDRIQGYDFWVHWEESWVCTRPFLAEALEVMETSELTQLQATKDWLDMPAKQLQWGASPRGTRYVQVLPDAQTGQPSANIKHGWPLYSLRPSINRADFCRQVGRFDENPRMWPVRFERDYGLRWLRQGATKAVLVPQAAERQPNHRSTY